MNIDGISINADFNYSHEEFQNYVKYVRERVPDVTDINIKLCPDGYANLNYTAKGILLNYQTNNGYRVGTIGRWNDAKRYEESERVKHAG